MIFKKILVKIWSRAKLILICFVAMVLALFAVVHLPLLFIKQSSDGLWLWRKGNWAIRVYSASRPSLAGGPTEGWAPFGEKQPLYTFQLGWVCYFVSRQPSAAELRNRLVSTSVSDQFDALWCLIRIPDPESRKMLHSLLKDERPVIRAQAAQALWELGDSAGIVVIQQDAKSTDTFTADMARGVLTTMK